MTQLPTPNGLDQVAESDADWKAIADELGTQQNGRIRCALLIISGEPANRVFTVGLERDWCSFADGLLRDILGAESPRLKARYGWHNYGIQSQSVFGPLVLYFGDYDNADLDKYLDTQDALDRLLAAEPFAREAVVFRGSYQWILNLFGFGCMSENVGVDVLRQSFDPTGEPRQADPLQGERFRSFLQGELTVGEGYHLCLLSGDVRRASQSAIEFLQERVSDSQRRTFVEIRDFEARWRSHFEERYDYQGFVHWDLSDPRQVAEKEEFEADREQQDREREELYGRLNVRPAPQMPNGWRGTCFDRDFGHVQDLVDYLDCVKASIDVVPAMRSVGLITEIQDAICNARFVLDQLNVHDRPTTVVADSEAAALQALDEWRTWARAFAHSHRTHAAVEDANIVNREPKPAVKPKSSTVPGEARAKIVAGLSHHHQFDGESCLNCDPIQVNRFAKEIGVGRSTLSEFLGKEFGVDGKDGYQKYQVFCRDSGSLNLAMKILLGELRPGILHNSLNEPDQLEDSGADALDEGL